MYFNSEQGALNSKNIPVEYSRLRRQKARSCRDYYDFLPYHMVPISVLVVTPPRNVPGTQRDVPVCSGRKKFWLKKINTRLSSVIKQLWGAAHSSWGERVHKSLFRAFFFRALFEIFLFLSSTLPHPLSRLRPSSLPLPLPLTPSLFSSTFLSLEMFRTLTSASMPP